MYLRGKGMSSDNEGRGGNIGEGVAVERDESKEGRLLEEADVDVDTTESLREPHSQGPPEELGRAVELDVRLSCARL